MKVKQALRFPCRSGVAIAAAKKSSSGPHADKRERRANMRNESRDLLEEYEEWQLDMLELESHVEAAEFSGSLSDHTSDRVQMRD